MVPAPVRSPVRVCCGVDSPLAVHDGPGCDVKCDGSGAELKAPGKERARPWACCSRCCSSSRSIVFRFLLPAALDESNAATSTFLRQPFPIHRTTFITFPDPIRTFLSVQLVGRCGHALDRGEGQRARLNRSVARKDGFKPNPPGGLPRLLSGGSSRMSMCMFAAGGSAGGSSPSFSSVFLFLLPLGLPLLRQQSNCLNAALHKHCPPLKVTATLSQPFRKPCATSMLQHLRRDGSLFTSDGSCSRRHFFPRHSVCIGSSSRLGVYPTVPGLGHRSVSPCLSHRPGGGAGEARRCPSVLLPRPLESWLLQSLLEILMLC